MVAIRVSSNINKARSELKRDKSQVPFATSKTLNDLAFTSKRDVDKQINTRLDRPTRFAQRSIEVVKSSKRKLVSTVKVRDRQKQSAILNHLFTGGVRRGKGLEGKLIGMGVLPRGKYIVPGEKALIDSFGNIRRSFIKKLVTGLQQANISKGNVSTLHPGVWVRKFDRSTKKKRKAQGLGGAFEFFVVHKQIKGTSRKKGTKRIKPEAVLLFVDRPKYRRIFNMEETVKQVILKDLDREFNKNYQFALRTAK